MARRDSERETSGSRGTHDDGISRRRVLRTTGAAGVSLAGVGAASGSVTAQDGDAGVFEACVGDWPDAPEDLPTVDARGEGYETANVPQGEDEVLFYVHGWVEFATGGGEGQAVELQRALEQAGYDHPVIAGLWPSNSPNWWGIKGTADEVAVDFADWIDDYLGENPDTTFRLVGHSMGGYTSLAILNELRGRQVLESVSLLGASVDADTVCTGARFAPGIEEVAEQVRDYHSEQDQIMCKIYRLGEFGDHGLGCGGSDCDGWFDDGLPNGYADVDVVGDVDGHCAYMRGDGQGCVDRVVADFDDGGDGGGASGERGGGSAGGSRGWAGWL